MKKYLVPAGLLLSALLLYFLFWGSDERRANHAASGIERFPYPTDRLAESRSEYLLQDIQAGKVDLALELIRLRRDCAGELEEAACNERIRQIILELPGKDRQRLAELFDQYLQFETKMRQNLPENFERLSYPEKYRLMKKARRDFFGDEVARLLFGMEEARIALQEEQAKFSSPEYANLAAAERIRLYEERKKDILGPYYQSLLEREPPDIKYGTELMLVQTDIAKLPEADRTRLMADLRVKHFGAVEAQRMESEERQASQATSEAISKMDQFLAAEKEYIRNNPSQTDEERRNGIEELRRSILGR